MKTYVRKALLLAVAMVLVLSVSGRTAENPFSPYVVSYPTGRIDWDNGIIYGVGRGYLHANGGQKGRALRAAQTLALQSILKLAAGINLDDRDTLRSLGGGRMVVRLQALIRFKEEGTRFVQDTDRSYFEVTRRAPLKGVEGLTTRLLDHFQSARLGWPAFPETRGEESPAPSAETETWLVLDGRGLPKGDDVAPALFPKIVTPLGETVYDLNQVERYSLEERGMARYVVSDRSLKDWQSRGEDTGGILAAVRDLFGPGEAFAEEEKGDRRRRRRRLVVKEVKDAGGLTNTNLVISQEDARAIKAEDDASKILKKCRVIVVVNSPIGGIEGRLPWVLARKERAAAP
jgi:hypothetical protein